MIGLASNSTTLTYTVSSSIQVGYVYKFRYRAKNIFGWGSYSDTLSLYAASVPNTISTVTTANSGTNVVISWTAPAYNGGSTVLSYRVKI